MIGLKVDIIQVMKHYLNREPENHSDFSSITYSCFYNKFIFILIKGPAEFYFTHYACVIIILFNTG